MTRSASLATARTFLFVPGDRAERFQKAIDSGADAVILDLEDAVAPAKHGLAIDAVVRALAADSISALVRIHPTSDPAHEIEVAALLRSPLPGLRGVVVAKADDAAAITATFDRFPVDLPVIPLVESAAGLLAARELAGVRGVVRLAFGAVDYSLDIGARPDRTALDFARSTLVVASRVAGIAAPLDSPPLSISDLDSVAEGALHARSLGFGGGLAIHPAQLPHLRSGFAPTRDEVEWARAVLAAEGDAGAGQVNGQLVDRPVFDRARAILRDEED